jgi:4'-phosphopantetheinyl transferase EntD
MAHCLLVLSQGLCLMRRPLLRELVPKTVVVEERFEDPPEVDLFPEEAVVVANAIEKRRQEFATVRVCARAALAALGVSPEPILPWGNAAPAWARRAPRWPVGIVGSMTHCDGYRAAALARRSDVASIGVDAEPHLPLPTGVASVIATPDERDIMTCLDVARPDVAWGRVLFSAKESVYKAWFPLTGQWLNFDDCAVTLHPDMRTFTARLFAERPSIASARIERFEGCWRLLSPQESQTATGLIGTVVVVSADIVPGKKHGPTLTGK